MNITKEEIAQVDFDKATLVKQVLEYQTERNFVITCLTTDPNIMVYYHCYYILDEATRIQPELFIRYWDDLVRLLSHPNSYHRDIGLTLLANLTPADQQHLFDHIFDLYLDHIHDKKFKTGVSCIIHLGKILETRRDLWQVVFPHLLGHRKQSPYSEKQEEYINGEIITIFNHFLDLLEPVDQEKALRFIQNCHDSKSPRTRKIAKNIIKNRGLAGKFI